MVTKRTLQSKPMGGPEDDVLLPPATACCGFECSRSYRADKRFESLPRSAAPALIAVRAGLGRCFETRDTRWRGADCETGAYMNEAPGEPGHWSVVRYPVRYTRY